MLIGKFSSLVMETTQFRGSVHIPVGSEIVTDADEEIFVIYSNLQASSSKEHVDVNTFRGLGHVNSRKDTLDLVFELKGRVDTSPNQDRKSRSRKKPQNRGDTSIEINLLQDTTSLRSRKGDTGSVVWKASIDFGQRILQENHIKSPANLFDFETLRSHHVLELGSGTGLLGILLSPLVRRYTATDIDSLMPLIRKNIANNFVGWPSLTPGTPGSNVSVENLDWETLHSSPQRQQNTVFAFEEVDLILVVDCIYHPSLVPSLLSTIDHLCIPNQTAVLVISELRSEDVLREFLSSWLSRPRWEIWHISETVLDNPHYVVWLGWLLPGES